MKNLIAIAIVILSLVFTGNALAQSADNGLTDAAQPTLRGEEAIKKLKTNGQYDSLVEAVKDARKKDGQTEEPQAEDLFAQTARLTASDGSAFDEFGISVAVSGETAIVGSRLDDVGANTDQGSAYIFVRNGTVWTQQAQLTAMDGAADDQFGISVSISGETAIVGANLDDVGGNNEQGSAYIFVRNGTTWTAQQKLTAMDGVANAQFGNSVSISGETVIIGANRDDVGGNFDQGSAYIFVRSVMTWTAQQKLLAADGMTSDIFGVSVSISGETVIVGASGNDFGLNINQGSAYIFVRSGITWTAQQKLLAADGAADDNFGRSVAISGETAIVGSSLDDVGANTNQGSAYIFVRSGIIWTAQQKLTAMDGATFNGFGTSVAISGDTVIVDGYIFARSGMIWTQQQKLTDDFYPDSVAISGSNVIVGNIETVGANTSQGAAYVFRVLGPTWSQEAQKVSLDGAAGDNFGWSVSISGDTAIVGAYLDDVGGNLNQGSAYIFVRSGTTWTQQAQLTAADGEIGDFFGWSVAISGEKAIVGSVFDNVGANFDQGSAYIFVRSGTTWTQQAQVTATGGGISDFFGTSVSISSFGNKVVVGAAFDNVGANGDQGSAYIFVLSGATWIQEAQLNAAGGTGGDLFGRSVSISGNANSETVIVGADSDDVGANTDQGSVYVFVFSLAVWTQQAQLTASDGAASDFFGISVAINDDTAIVGAWQDDVGANANQGSAYIFFRNGMTWTQQVKLTATDGAADDQFGYSVAISGEIAIVGAPTNDVGANGDQGSAYIFVREVTTWTQQQNLTATGGVASDNFGWSVAVSGDKIFVGTPLSDASVSVPLIPQANDQGAAFTFVNQPLGPTAANVSVSGRVMTADGRGLRNANVSLTDSNGITRSVRTSSFGYYSFEEVEVGQTVILTVTSKRYQFAPQVFSLVEAVTDLNFIAQPD